MSQERNALENFLEQLTESGAKDANVGVRYEVDYESMSSLDAQAGKDARELAAAAEYAIRILARRDENARAKIDGEIESVIVRGGTAEPGTRDEEWKRAEQAAKDAKRKLRPNDPAYTKAGERQKYEHYVVLRRDGRKIIAEAAFKNAAYAGAGTFYFREWIAELLGLPA